jgi:hypothetical protein
MVCDSEEVVSRFPVESHDFGGGIASIGVEGVSVDVALEPAAFCLEGIIVVDSQVDRVNLGDKFYFSWHARPMNRINC